MLNQVKIKPGKVGEAEIRVDVPSDFERLRGRMHGQPLNFPAYTRLLLHGSTMMTDAEFEIATNSDFAVMAKGDVLIAGLGIGLILPPAIKKARSVTVVEKSADVIALVAEQYADPKLKIVHADINAYAPEAGTVFQTIYFDIWPNICGDYYAEIKALKKKFRPYLAKDGWMGAWCEDRMRSQAR